MPVYTSVAAMIEARPEINSISTVTTVVLGSLADQAEALVNGYVGKRYTLPLSGAYPLLTALATDLAVYRVLSRRLYTTAEKLEASGAQALHAEATDVLSGIAAGIVPLVDSSGTVLAAATLAAPVFNTTKGWLPTFHEGPRGTHVVDEDKVDDALERRDLGSTKDLLL